MNNSDYALEIKNLSISFGGLKAVNDLSFYIKKKDSGYFSQGNGSVFCGNTQVEPLLHETGHALHYYTVQCKTPDDYNEIVAKARQNPELLVKAEKLFNE